MAILAWTAVMRIPSCGESFWLDELHSVWVASGSLEQVGRRAALGNQVPTYFYGLWIWTQFFGDGELALRATSVVFACLTSAGLTLAVALRTKRLAAGLVAGGLFAADPNAIFFGCELRPYAAVMLCAFAACAFAMLGGIGPDSSRAEQQLPQSRAARSGLLMMLWIALAAIIHPTSLIVLGWFIPAACVWRLVNGGPRVNRFDSASVAVVLFTMIALWSSSLPRSWQRRELWKAFGGAGDVAQLWQAWDFWPLVIAPLAAALALSLIAYFTDSSAAKRIRWTSAYRFAAITPLAVGLLGTGSCFVLAFWDWVPLWQRRYFVAALPLIAWTAGEWVAIAQKATDRWRRPRVAAWLLALGLLAFQFWSTGYWATVTAGHWPRELRGERWREVVARVAADRGEGELIWLDSGLIEARFLVDPENASPEVDAAQWDYLAFPLSSVYALDPVTVMACWEHPDRTAKRVERLPEGPVTVWLISRGGAKSRDAFLRRVQGDRRVSVKPVAGGRPSVTRIEFRPRRS